MENIFHILLFKYLTLSPKRNYKYNYIYKQAETEVQWENAKIVGNYFYTNSTYYEDGDYEIKFETLKYLANTPFSDNTIRYPCTVPKSSISYEKMSASFSKKYSEVNDIKHLPNIK